MAFTVEDLHDLIHLLEREPAWLTDVRRVVLTKEVLALPEQLTQVQQTTAHELRQLTIQVTALTSAQRHTDEQVQQLTTQVAALTTAQSRTDERLAALVQAQSRTDERLAALAQAQSRTEEQLQQLTTQVAALTSAQGRMETELRQVVTWQRGEAGRRDGERYERDILRQAPALFNGGQGGPTDDPMVQQRLAAQLGDLLEDQMLDASANPLLLDVVWWKEAEMAAVEVSRHVDRQDITRVAQRAAMLRRSGAQVSAMVIGEQWATEETRGEAQSQQVEWKVGAELSRGFLAFRQRKGQ